MLAFFPRRHRYVDMRPMRTSVVSRPNRFDKIPNETLDLIISFIPLDEFVSYRGPAYQKL
jgi:hypothetical protein